MNDAGSAGSASEGGGKQKLAKNLKLFDVYAMATGAMFSSGLFLLPGIAASYTGNSVYLAYLAAGFLILPAMYCMAELSTAMPKAGGTYFFLDRSMGPLMGTIGGLGSWVAVVFKSAFALVGMGAYLGIYLDVPVTVTAMALTVVFGLVNVFGAKETTMLQRVLVSTLVVILAAFVIFGLAEVGVGDLFEPEPGYAFFSDGLMGFVATIGLVFVSYAGLTKVASVAEEIENPDRNIPLGMTLSLVTASIIYTLGTLVLVKVLPPQQLFDSLTPVADAGRQFLGWAPLDLGVVLIVVSAIAAFASTANAGVMSASRYPFAMAKDRLVPERFSHIGRFGTPTVAILATSATMIAVLALFDVASVAKLASAFQLLLFGLVSVAVIVMRESGIDSYKPGFRVPLYPWVPIAGILIAFWLIIEMGLLPIAFTGMLVIGCGLWYQFYASDRVKRRGAIFHVHRNLGRSQYEGIEHELMTIVHERTQAENLSYEEVVARSAMTDYPTGRYDLESLVVHMARVGEERFDLPEQTIRGAFDRERFEVHVIREQILLTYQTSADAERPELFVFRFGPEAEVDLPVSRPFHTMMFLLLPEEPVGLDLRIAGHLAEVVHAENFTERWLSARSERELNEILMRDDHFVHARVEQLPWLAEQGGHTVGEVRLPGTCLLVMIERDGALLIAQPDVRLERGDLVSIIGEPEDLARLRSAPETEPAEEAAPASQT